jgi:hypothetical protein
VDAVNLAKYEAGRSFAHSQGWGWAVFTLGDTTLTTLRNRRVPSHLIQQFESKLRNGAITTSILKSIGRETPFEWIDLLAATLQHGWIMEHDPFRLSITDEPNHHAIKNGSRRP